MTKNRSRQLFVVLFIAVIFLFIFIKTGIFSSAKAQAAEVPVYKYYTSIEIESGDTLTDIAHTYMGDQYDSVRQYIDEVIQMNGLTSETIHAGQHLTVPYYSSELL